MFIHDFSDNVHAIIICTQIQTDKLPGTLHTLIHIHKPHLVLVSNILRELVNDFSSGIYEIFSWVLSRGVVHVTNSYLLWTLVTYFIPRLGTRLNKALYLISEIRMIYRVRRILLAFHSVDLPVQF